MVCVFKRVCACLQANAVRRGRHLNTSMLRRHPSYFVGLLLRGTQLPYANFGHVVLAKPSPILFYPISSKEVLVSTRCEGCRRFTRLWPPH